MTISIEAITEGEGSLWGFREDDMGKGQVKGNRETKKPKAEKPKGPGSPYKQSQGKGGQALSPQPVRKT